MAEAAIFLCYGKVAAPEVARRNEGAEVLARGGGLGRQVAWIGPDTPAFRLNTPGWIAPAPELIAALDTGAALRLLCRDRLLATCPSFAPRARDFLTAWLDAAEADDGSDDGPDDGSEAPGEVSAQADRFFAALLPLPHVQIALPGGNGFATFDIAFWDGSALAALRFGMEAGLLPRQRREIGALQDALGPRLRVLWLSADAGPGAVPEPLHASARTAPLPVFGPYRAPVFQAPLPEHPTGWD